MGFLTLLVNAWRAERENKKHTAAVAEDLAKRTATTALLLAHKANLDLSSLKSDVKENTDITRGVSSDVQENTQITKGVGDRADAAYKEANDINRKIEAVAKTKLDKEQADRIEEVTTDTNAKVSKLTGQG